MSHKIHHSEYRDFDIEYNHISYKAPSISFNFHAHDAYELIFLKSGKITYATEGKSYQVQKNSLILTRHSDRHSIQVNNDSAYERYNFLFNKKILSSDIMKSIPHTVEVLSLDNYPIISKIFDKTDYYTEHFDGARLKILLSHLIEEILCNIVILSTTLSEDASIKASNANPIMMRALNYIEKNLSNNFTLEELCQELHITKSYLHHLFMSYLQISPKKYVITKRLAIAQKVIRSGEKPTDIYYECGFSDYSTFYRSYKNYFGYSPSEESNKTGIILTIQS